MAAARDWGTRSGRHHINHVLGAVAAVARRRTPSSCWRPWPGSGRISQGAAPARSRSSRPPPCCVGGLRWLSEDWEPPQDLAVFVGRSRAAKAIATPLEVEHLLALVKAIPDSRWRFAFQLMATYGLRPEELQHLQIRQGRLWCMDEKVASRGKTRPRVLRALPCDDWADGWRLDVRLPTQELPPIQPGLGGGYVGHYWARGYAFRSEAIHLSRPWPRAFLRSRTCCVAAPPSRNKRCASQLSK